MTVSRDTCVKRTATGTPMALNPLYCLSPSQALGAKKKQDSWLCLYRTVHSVTSGESLGSQGPLMTSCCCRLPTSVARASSFPPNCGSGVLVPLRFSNTPPPRRFKTQWLLPSPGYLLTVQTCVGTHTRAHTHAHTHTHSYWLLKFVFCCFCLFVRIRFLSVNL